MKMKAKAARRGAEGGGLVHGRVTADTPDVALRIAADEAAAAVTLVADLAQDLRARGARRRDRFQSNPMI